MTAEEEKALRHITVNGSDRNLRGDRWREIKLSLYQKGLIKRRIGDWAWILVR